MRTTLEIRGEKGMVIPSYTMNHVWKTTCDYFNVNPNSALGKCRKHELLMCRHITAYILRYDYKMTWVDIGKFLGGRDHTTAINSINKMKGWMKTEHRLVYEVYSIRELINSPATIEKYKQCSKVVSF